MSLSDKPKVVNMPEEYKYNEDNFRGVGFCPAIALGISFLCASICGVLSFIWLVNKLP